jgi:multisubunit Na+/H+ antiporter MnhB subunit
MVRRRAAGSGSPHGIVPRVGEAADTSRRDRLRGALAALAALHSVGVGLGLAFLPGWSTALAGFPPVTPVFFARQGGAFHLVLGVAYWLEHRRAGTTWLLLLAKGTATAFLGAATLAGGVPWSVPASLLGDAAMALCAWLLRPRAG